MSAVDDERRHCSHQQNSGCLTQDVSRKIDDLLFSKLVILQIQSKLGVLPMEVVILLLTTETRYKPSSN